MPARNQSRLRMGIRWGIRCAAGVLIFVAFTLVISVLQFGMDPADWSRRRMMNISNGPPVYIHAFDVDESWNDRLEDPGVLFLDDRVYILNDVPQHADGMLSAWTAHRNTDGRVLFTRVHRYSMLHVMIEGNHPTGDALRPWRRLAADHYDAPELRRAQVRTRTIVFGYPMDWLKALGRLCVGVFWTALFIAPLAAVGLLVVMAGRAIKEITNPQLRRLRILLRGRCPKCRYDIRGLPAHRCPECGEEWTARELDPQALSEARAAMRQ